MGIMKLAKSAVDYSGGMRYAHCGICAHYEASRRCEIVEGEIDPAMWCKRFNHVQPHEAPETAPSRRSDAVTRIAIELDRLSQEIIATRHVLDDGGPNCRAETVRRLEHIATRANRIAAEAKVNADLAAYSLRD
jgi:hypothetical protein